MALAQDSTAAAPEGIEVGPVANVLGRILVTLGLMMLPPAFVDWSRSSANAWAFLSSAFITCIVGVLVVLATQRAIQRSLTIRQAYLLTFLIWSVLPFFGALPLMLGEPGLHLTDAYFESVSGLTTTGATVIVGLDQLPHGTNLWRGLLNWTGGLGIVFVAMIFLPAMRVGGMQMFRAEAFDTFGKVLPRASDIAKALLQVYLILSAVIVLTYAALGMEPLDAVVNAMGTVSTGGFSSSDLSFGKYPGAIEYLCGIFMCVSALPYVRYIQLLRNQPGPILRDEQVRFFLLALAAGVLISTLWAVLHLNMGVEPALRQSFVNLASIATGTGFFSGSFVFWEGPALVVAFIIGFLGGCSGSSTGAMSSFRVMLTLRVLWARIRQIQSPSRVIPIRYDGQPVGPDVIDSLMVFMTAYIFGLGVIAVGIALSGADSYSALIGSWMALGNIGYGFGPLVAATGTFIEYPEPAKWLMSLAMLLGRLGLMSIFVLVLPRFWQR